MFNGNTSADFAALDQLLGAIDTDTRASTFIVDAMTRYQDFYEQTYGTDNPGELRVIMDATKTFLDATATFHTGMTEIYEENLRELARMAREFTRPYIKAKIEGRLRKLVFERDAYRCRHCGGWKDLSVDHIFPEVLGGTLDLSNLQTLCRPCNSRKGARV